MARASVTRKAKVENTTPRAKPDPKNGMGAATEEPKAAVKTRAKAIDAQFAEADAKGAPTKAEIAEVQLGLAVRGY